MSKGEEYGASATLSKELIAEDPAGFKNDLRMDLEKINELIPCSTHFSRKRRLCFVVPRWCRFLLWSIPAPFTGLITLFLSLLQTSLRLFNFSATFLHHQILRFFKAILPYSFKN